MLKASLAATPLAFLAACLFPAPAIAAQARAFLGSDGTVYSSGHVPGEMIELGFPATEARRRVRASWCWLRVKHSESYPSQLVNVQVGGSAIALDPATLPVRDVDCTDNVLSPPQSGPWQDSDGAFYVPVTMGLTSGVVYALEYPNQAYIRRRKVNACGYITVRDAAELGDGIFLPTTAGDGSSAYFALVDMPQGTRLYCHTATGTELRADQDSFPMLANSSTPPVGMPGPGGGGGGGGGISLPTGESACKVEPSPGEPPVMLVQAAPSTDYQLYFWEGGDADYVVNATSNASGVVRFDLPLLGGSGQPLSWDSNPDGPINQLTLFLAPFQNPQPLPDQASLPNCDGAGG